MTGRAFFFAFWFLFAAVLLVRIYFALRVRRAGERLLPDRQAIQREGFASFAIRVIAFLILIAVLALFAINPPWLSALTFPLPGGLRWAGFGLGLLSVGLLAWTEAELGSLWSAQLQLRQEHQLITSGPYARVRHPLYTAMYGLGLAFALVTASWIFVAFLALVVAGMGSRVGKEEQMMLEEFGEEYRAYMRRTGRYFPR
jgi:protein-S-isoprenylcysteine O-methyltransferase Ste14